VFAGVRAAAAARRLKNSPQRIFHASGFFLLTKNIKE
jgi:hypothetical protein